MCVETWGSAGVGSSAVCSWRGVLASGDLGSRFEFMALQLGRFAPRDGSYLDDSACGLMLARNEKSRAHTGRRGAQALTSAPLKPARKFRECSTRLTDFT